MVAYLRVFWEYKRKQQSRMERFQFDKLHIAAKLAAENF